ncbi:PadR family transcriptional regulator [Nocardia sp. NPDC004068]|uniref:PadR family transcriptional regulator n=1 Tax=Nocardia sp. NPDC004068 TaxID=3364303 RepID=UPI0036821258
MAKQRKVGNLLALSILATLFERPMHRYEIAARLRERGKEGQLDIKWGSLYTVVQNLEKHGYLETVGTERAGSRPERTIYRVTDAGRAETEDWIRELLATVEPEHSRFVAGMSHWMMIPPDEVIDLLGERLARLTALITAEQAALDELAPTLPRLFLVEEEYRLTMRRAEAEWVRALRDELVSGTFPNLEWWRRMHAENMDPAEVVEMVERGEIADPN